MPRTTGLRTSTPPPSGKAATKDDNAPTLDASGCFDAPQDRSRGYRGVTVEDEDPWKARHVSELKTQTTQEDSMLPRHPHPTVKTWIRTRIDWIAIMRHTSRLSFLLHRRDHLCHHGHPNCRVRKICSLPWICSHVVQPFRLALAMPVPLPNHQLEPILPNHGGIQDPISLLQRTCICISLPHATAQLRIWPQLPPIHA
eukprot:TRINITY_DN61812_c0_g1_i1.p1 TRINITY_DN61812_c0_g1~~TRINITY_DN61812_c0_g1_i1.p1  ORF type:complete len:199 (+),score=6.14 TRINITY_DN61812_c0_g1_i1:70-666(+)